MTRRRAIMALATIGLAACLARGTGHAAPIAKTSGERQRVVDDFWSAFREAVGSNDRAAIVRLTNFPFVVRWGDADPHDPSVEYERDEFQTTLGRLLSLKTGDSDGKTMTRVLTETPRIQNGDISSGTFIVGDFEFRLVGGAWRWTAAFTADPSFYPASESSPIPRISPLRKFILDVTSSAAHLKRPLTVKHLRTTGEVAYLEAQEPGKGGRTVRALLQRQPDDVQGQMVWLVKDYSFKPPEGADGDWRNRIDTLVKSGLPATLFPPRGSSREQAP